MILKTIGVIGGLGPMATVYYLEQITRMTDAKRDQDHPRIIMVSIPNTPDRTEYILDKGKKSPLPCLIRAGKDLVRMGVDFITVPCVTAQYFYQELCEALCVPVISLCANIADEIAARQIQTVGILGTNGTIHSHVLEREFEKVGVAVVVPDQEGQHIIMRIIYEQVKNGCKADMENFYQVSNSLLEFGAEKIILGCTELSLLTKQIKERTHYVDVLEVLAQKAVRLSGATLRDEYENVIR